LIVDEHAFEKDAKKNKKKKSKKDKKHKSKDKLALLDLRKKLLGLNPTKMTDKLPKRKSKRRRRSRRRLTQGKRIRKEMKIKFQ